MGGFKGNTRSLDYSSWKGPGDLVGRIMMRMTGDSVWLFAGLITILPKSPWPSKYGVGTCFWASALRCGCRRRYASCRLGLCVHTGRELVVSRSREPQ